MNIDFFSACGLAECGILHVFAFRTGAGSTSGRFHSVMVRRMENPIIFQNGHNQARFPEDPAKPSSKKEGKRL